MQGFYGPWMRPHVSRGFFIGGDMKYTKHKLNLYPEVKGDEYEKLKVSISAGFDKTFPIIVYQGAILDGWNRYRACTEVDIEPTFKDFSGTDDDALMFVIRSNERRDLDASKRACIAVEYEPIFARMAKERQLATLKQNKGKESTVPANLPERTEGEARQQAADMVGVGARYVTDAKRIKNEAPELYDRIINDVDYGIQDAKKEIKERAKKERIEIIKNRLVEKINSDRFIDIMATDKKFRVIYADPPWQYPGEQHGKEAQDTVLNSHYPTMPTCDIADLPVKNITEKDAVLFIWTTWPKLFETQEIINAWGFKYKSGCVWDKVKHNVGYYFSVRSELLLLATRGSCLPDMPTLDDNVISIERTEHSVKPKEFIALIDKMYPIGKRIELFCRENKMTNWHFWGNQQI
jgi:N6-adenosine-specific RNA methylase IME4